MRTLRPLAWLALAIGVVLIFVFAARYTQSVNEQLLSPAADDLGVRFLENPIPLPDFPMRTLAGETLTPQGLRGKVVIVNFWATWCHPCQAEIPELIKLQNKYPEELTVIGVSAEIPGHDLSNDARSREIARRFAEEWHINYAVVMQTDRILDAFTGIFALPTSFVIDQEGRIVQKHVGLISPVIFEREVRALVGF